MKDIPDNLMIVLIVLACVPLAPIVLVFVLLLFVLVAPVALVACILGYRKFAKNLVTIRTRIKGKDNGNENRSTDTI